ncbi:MAG: hypothetical protein J7539_16065 [Niabella sp.]|nr:hypothetical protein [Niabella sp.]
MKRVILISCIMLIITMVKGQTNVFPASGNVGIGTTTPQTALHVNGTVRSIISEYYDAGNYIGFIGKGGTLTGGWANTPNTFALTYQNSDFVIGGWGKSDGLWKDASLYINSDNGNVGIGTTTPGNRLDVNGNMVALGGLASVISSPDIGGTISLGNPAKTANGTASTWRIFNMSGGYGNSLQFWAYDNLGCASGGMCANRFTIMDNGYVGIGTNTPREMLSVNGNIRSREIKVETVNWPDYVFKPAYQLTPLDKLENYIKVNGHLPEVLSAKEVAEKGIALGANQAVLLKKIEELTLHLIEMDKELRKQKEEIKEQRATNRKQAMEIRNLKVKKH